VLLAASIVGLFFLPSPLNAILFGVAVVLEIGEIFLWIKFLERYRVRGGAEGMVGEKATVIDACDPAGLVRVRGEVWKAVAEPGEAFAEGERAVVRSVEGLSVTVGRPR
jgi:membrane-bound serine protease (ClpP class)